MEQQIKQLFITNGDRLHIKRNELRYIGFKNLDIKGKTMYFNINDTYRLIYIVKSDIFYLKSTEDKLRLNFDTQGLEAFLKASGFSNKKCKCNISNTEFIQMCDKCIDNIKLG